MGELTPAELRAIRLASMGHGVKGTAQVTRTSVNTVKQQRSRAIRKLGCASMPHAVRVAIEKGLLSIGDRR